MPTRLLPKRPASRKTPLLSLFGLMSGKMKDRTAGRSLLTWVF